MTPKGEGRAWKHKRGDRYVHITVSLVGNPDRGYRFEHYLGAGEFDTVSEARRVGLRDLGRSDDFNIGAIRAGKLAATALDGRDRGRRPRPHGRDLRGGRPVTFPLPVVREALAKGWYDGPLLHGWLHAACEELEATREVLRRLLSGWNPYPFNGFLDGDAGPVWWLDDSSDPAECTQAPMSDAEVTVLRGFMCSMPGCELLDEHHHRDDPDWGEIIVRPPAFRDGGET